MQNRNFAVAAFEACLAGGSAGGSLVERGIHRGNDGDAANEEAQTLSPFGLDLFGADAAPKPNGPVAERFLFAPFSVLDARSGEWQERKRAWLALGIKSEIGRVALPGGGGPNSLMRQAGMGEEDGAHTGSIFDPVLAELAYRWFCPPRGIVVDPFAGGSVRGIVAQKIGLDYYGIELRSEQVAANREQGRDICSGQAPLWIVGDALEMLPLAMLPLSVDFVFSCPPYGNLERYSNDERDLSAMDWPDYREAYRAIIARAVVALADNRFACFVVGNFRDRRGVLRDLVGETVSAFEAAGASFYNDAVLVTAVGTASMRVSAQFDSGRKLARTHQSVLVFCKGDPKLATKAIRG